MIIMMQLVTYFINYRMRFYLQYFHIFTKKIYAEYRKFVKDFTKFQMIVNYGIYKLN